MKLDWKREDGLKFTAAIPGGVLNVGRYMVGTLRYEWWGWSNRTDGWDVPGPQLTKIASDSPEECMAEMERRYFSWLLEEAVKG